MYEAGVPVLIQRFSRLDDLPALESYCSFVLKRPERALSIHNLELGYLFDPEEGGIPPKIVSSLADVLRNCHNIESLKLLDPEIVFHYQELAEAVIAWTSLKEIELQNVDVRATEVLARIRSPITAANISVDYSDEDLDPEEDCIFDPALICMEYPDTLSTIFVLFPGSIGSYPHIQHPNVHRIEIEGDPIVVHLRSFAQSFPNLRDFIWRWDIDTDPREAERMREDIEGGELGGSLAWHSLEHLWCTASRAYSMALTCQVRFWDGIYLGNEVSSLNARRQLIQLRVALEDIRPQQLVISVHVKPYTLDDLSHIFPSINTTQLMIRFQLNKCKIDVRELLVRYA